MLFIYKILAHSNDPEMWGLLICTPILFVGNIYYSFKNLKKHSKRYVFFSSLGLMLFCISMALILLDTIELTILPTFEVIPLLGVSGIISGLAIWPLKEEYKNENEYPDKNDIKKGIKGCKICLGAGLYFLFVYVFASYVIKYKNF